MAARTGLVKKLHTDKGFGFIRETDGRELFFHRSDVIPQDAFADLDEGMQVEYDEVMPVPSKGRRACRVSIIA